MTTTGLRDRRRAQTRREIADAARQLFAADGFDATSVAAIAERAGVGERTFYRYFPTKEHVAVDHLEGFIAHGVALIEDRPDDEHPLDSIRAAVAELARHDYAGTLALDAVLVDTVAGVAGVQHHLVVTSQDRLTEVFARRLGVPGSSLDARLYAVVCTAAYQAATRAWMAALAAGEPADVWALAAEVVDRLGGGLRVLDERREAVAP